MFFDEKNSKSSEFYYLEAGLYTRITDIVEAMTTLIQKRHNDSEICITVKMSMRSQNLRYTFQMKDMVFHFLVRTWDTFSEVIFEMNLQ